MPHNPKVRTAATTRIAPALPRRAPSRVGRLPFFFVNGGSTSRLLCAKPALRSAMAMFTRTTLIREGGPKRDQSAVGAALCCLAMAVRRPSPHHPTRDVVPRRVRVRADDAHPKRERTYRIIEGEEEEEEEAEAEAPSSLLPANRTARTTQQDDDEPLWASVA